MTSAAKLYVGGGSNLAAAGFNFEGSFLTPLP